MHPSPFEPVTGSSDLQYWRLFEGHSDKAVYYESISEVYSGDYLHEADKCFAQAWSVSELDRVIFRYLSA